MLHKILQLERPLAVFDLETTGLDTTRDRIIQIGITMYYPHKDPIVWKSLVNPGVPIRNQGTSHKITDDDVKDAPTFKDLAPHIARQIVDVDLSGHNASNYDIRMLKAEMKRANQEWLWDGHIIDTCVISRLVNPHTLANVVKQVVDEEIATMFGISLDAKEDFHDAGYDVAATGAALFGLLRKYEHLPRKVKDLAEFCLNKPPGAIDAEGKVAWINEQPCVTFGKWKGTPLQKIPQGYLVWAINSGNFPDDVVIIFGDALKGTYPVKTND